MTFSGSTASLLLLIDIGVANSMYLTWRELPKYSSRRCRISSGGVSLKQ